MANVQSACDIEGDTDMAHVQNRLTSLEGAPRSIDMHIDGKYEVWLVLDTNTLMESPEELLAFHAASRDSILPKSGAFKNIDLSINYFVAQAVIRELDSRKSAGHADDTAGNIARKARNAARLLDESELGQITFESSNDRSKAEMVFPEMLRDAALSRGDHHILLAAKYMQDVKYRSDSRNRVVIITEDVNLRSIAAGEGVMAVAGPSELPKKRKDFLPKMFPSLPEDSAATRMAARRAKYAENPELDALKQGLSTAHRRKPAPFQPEEHWTPSSRDAADPSRAFDAIYGSLRTAGGSGPVDAGLNRNDSGTPLQPGTHAAGMQGQQGAPQAGRSAAVGSGEARQHPGSLPSAAELLRVLDLGMRPCLEQYLPLLSPATWQQDAEALTSAQGLLACVFRHRAQLLMASESSNCTAAMLFLMKFAVNPQIRTPQEAQAALNAASLILAAFREPSTDSPSRQALLNSRKTVTQAAVHFRDKAMQDSARAPANSQAGLPPMGSLSMSEQPGSSAGFYMNGHLRGHLQPSPFQQPEEMASQGSTSGQMGRQAGSQAEYAGGNLQALQMLQAQALQQQHQQMQKQQQQQQVALQDQSARREMQVQLLRQHLQQQQQQEAASPHALSPQAYQQQLHAALQQREASLASHQQEPLSSHASLGQEQQQQLQAALQQRRSSESSSMQQEPLSPHDLASLQLRMSHSQERQHQQSPSPHALQQQQHIAESPRQQAPASLQQLLQQHQAMLEQHQREQQHSIDQRHSSHSEAGQHMESDHPDGRGMPGSSSESLSSQQAGSNLRALVSRGSTQALLEAGSTEGPPKGAKTAGLVQGVLQELTRTVGPQRRQAAKVMLDSLLTIVSTKCAADEEDTELLQAHQTAVRVLWARLLHMNGADMEEVRKGEPDMEDVLAYLSLGERDQAKRDAIALLDELFAQ